MEIAVSEGDFQRAPSLWNVVSPWPYELNNAEGTCESLCGVRLLPAIVRRDAGERLQLQMSIIALLIKHQHLSHAVGTDVQDVSGREIVAAVKALSHFIVPSFPLSPLNSVPWDFFVSFHEVWFPPSTGIVCFNGEQ